MRLEMWYVWGVSVIVLFKLMTMTPPMVAPLSFVWAFAVVACQMWVGVALVHAHQTQANGDRICWLDEHET